MEIDRAWAENFYVVKANALHERAHSGVSYSLRGRKTYTDVDLWNDELGIIGKTDCIEESKDGLCIVEYKPTKPKTELVRHDDAILSKRYRSAFCLMFKAIFLQSTSEGISTNIRAT